MLGIKLAKFLASQLKIEIVNLCSENFLPFRIFFSQTAGGSKQSVFFSFILSASGVSDSGSESAILF